MLYLVCVKLGFSEKEFWKMTLKKYVLLRDEYFYDNSEHEPEVFADELF